MEDEKNKKGEIKIMVIAAGFEYSSKNSNRAQSSSYTPLEKLNKKPFESTSSNLNDYNKDSIQTISIDEHSMEDFTDHSIDEIPAFLRKRKNK